ncbi:MAG TPA: hypothetical protein VN441_10890 [Syntrophomonas sp.]|nr:hypothetical protein [Syntrophomonas sp.]
MNDNKDVRYEAVMARNNEIMKTSVGIDYASYAEGPLAFDYERMMRESSYDFEKILKIQKETAVGNTPLIELNFQIAIAIRFYNV